MNKMLLAAAAATALISTAVFAAVTFDETTGTGFVGKGDVQLVYGWNNKRLNDNANSVRFRVNSETVTEVGWECTNARNENVQERSRTTTTSTQGIVTHIARDNKKQITGFILGGYLGGAATTSTETEGPAVNSCPNTSSTYYLSSPAGDPEVVSSTGALEVTDGSTWDPIG